MKKLRYLLLIYPVAIFFVTLYSGCANDAGTAARTGDEPRACNDAYRYKDEDKKPGTISVDLEVAQADVERFRVMMNPENRRGVFISKRALDQIFSQDSIASGVELFFAMGIEDSLNIIVTPSHSIYSRVDNSRGSNIFVSGSFCPDDCGVSLNGEPRDTTR